jgi:GST-like protein
MKRTPAVPPSATPIAAPSSPPWHLFVARGWGSVIAEAALTLAGIPYEREEIDPSSPGPGRDRLRATNPLGQFPTLLLPDGAVLTESAAIVLRAADLAPASGLAPAAGDPERTAFLRWLVFFVAALYPTFAYGDDPARWVAGAAGDELRAAAHAHRRTLWKQLEGEVVGPWFLGERFSALDLYVGIMTRWQPGRAWFAESCPRLHALALAVDRRSELSAVWAANFDP